MNKKELIAKIAKEQNLEPKDLEKLTIKVLEKMDIVVTDEDLMGDTQELPTETTVDHQPAVPAEKPVGKTFIGYHPISGEEVWV